MAFDGTTDCWWPSLPIQTKQTPRIRRFQYGDGYEQRILDGINYMDSEWSLSFEMRPEEVIIAMSNFLIAQAGHAFNWKHPVSEVLIKVWCDDWTINWEFKKYDPDGTRHDYGTLSATFRRAYGVSV